MSILVDVVNFNADASCMPSASWLSAMSGGQRSRVMEWLKLYVNRGKKLVLGLTGASIADLSIHNPESIALINRHTDVFEVLLRPFSHDIGLLRQGFGFHANVEWGRRTIEREFKQIARFFLPPEFMLTNDQVAQLEKQAVAGVFINSARFSPELGRRIPTEPYMLRGLFDAQLPCIPLRGELTDAYLHALHSFDCGKWNGILEMNDAELSFSWRDGESAFLIPDGIEREGDWLSGEYANIRRVHVSDLQLDFASSTELDSQQIHTYPVHSFSAWMKEFRMLGFVHRVQKIEERLGQLSPELVNYWLMVVNSDILSAIEKRSPVVVLRDKANDMASREYVIRRSDRGFEGEEYLAILEAAIEGKPVPVYVRQSSAPHMVKWRDRVHYLTQLQCGDI